MSYPHATLKHSPIPTCAVVILVTIKSTLPEIDEEIWDI